jgi:hypothetical protein
MKQSCKQMGEEKQQRKKRRKKKFILDLEHKIFRRPKINFLLRQQICFTSHFLLQKLYLETTVFIFFNFFKILPFQFIHSLHT